MQHEQQYGPYHQDCMKPNPLPRTNAYPQRRPDISLVNLQKPHKTDCQKRTNSFVKGTKNRERSHPHLLYASFAHVLYNPLTPFRFFLPPFTLSPGPFVPKRQENERANQKSPKKKQKATKEKIFSFPRVWLVAFNFYQRRLLCLQKPIPFPERAFFASPQFGALLYSPFICSSVAFPVSRWGLVYFFPFGRVGTHFLHALGWERLKTR
ncbi:hypothetical protein J3F84DRAFT_104575 [Trichoderma pleuroticola]